MPAMATKRIRPQSAWWIWNVSIWLGIGLFDATKTVFVMRSEGMHHAWMALFDTVLLSRLPWAFATPIVLRLGRPRPPGRLTSVATWSAHLIACSAIALVTAAWTAALEKLLNPWAYSNDAGPFLGLWRVRFYNGLLESIFLYAAILATKYILDSKDRRLLEETEKARLNEQLAKAKLNSLRRQIEPHFLFNTLNSIAAQVREGKGHSAVNMIAALSDVLRSAIADSNRQEVPLGDELELLQKYLNIQKVRFAERLNVKLDVPKQLLSAMVPGFMLQPIVENAIQHGIAKRARGGTVEISVIHVDGFLTVRVHNDGPALSPCCEETPCGVGISNLRDRLASLYGDVYKFTMQNRDAAGVEVFVSVPFREE